jgi:CheY-like chemotaxis protein
VDKPMGGVRRQRVLVVDDHPDTSEVLSILFQLLGHETRAVTRGSDALLATREFDPDLVVLDIGLPDISGYDVARALKSDHARPYLAAATGWGREQDRQRAHEAGFDHHVTKPLDLSTVMELLQLSDSQRPV